MNHTVLFILHVPPPINGAAMVGKAIQESDLINSAFDTDYVNLTTSFTLGEIGKGGFSKLFKSLIIQAKVIKQLLYKNYDLCYMTLTAKGVGFYKDLVVVAILKLFRKKIIYHFHNKGVSENSDFALNKFLYRFAFRNTHSILLSPYLYYDIANYVKKENVYFCANGIADNYTLKRTNTDLIPVKLLFLSNMMAEKGVYVLLKACQILKMDGYKFECHFIGAWSDIDELDFRAATNQLNISDFTFAHGKKYNDEKNAFFSDADIFVFPTFYHNECFPLVLLEAMSYGLPIVSTYEGGIPDIVNDGETGFLVPHKDEVALANKLEILIQHPELRLQMGKAGRKRYEDYFTLEKFEYRLKNILENAINDA